MNVHIACVSHADFGSLGPISCPLSVLVNTTNHALSLVPFWCLSFKRVHLCRFQHESCAVLCTLAIASSERILVPLPCSEA
jgi:hypothetical protein